MNSVGMGDYSDGMAMAMTMMMPPMELGAPSITSVMSDADGMATVMLMPGDNATKHWAWAAPTDGSEGMWHGDSALAGDADHGHLLWPDQRHELLVHRHRRSRYGHRLRMVRLERLDCGDAGPVTHG